MQSNRKEKAKHETLAGQGAWLGKPEGLAARSSANNISIHLSRVNGLSIKKGGLFLCKSLMKMKGGRDKWNTR